MGGGRLAHRGTDLRTGSYKWLENAGFQEPVLDYGLEEEGPQQCVLSEKCQR